MSRSFAGTWRRGSACSLSRATCRIFTADQSNREEPMKDRHSRREFMGLGAAGVAGALTPSWLDAAPSFAAQSTQNANPDLVVVNAKVYTMDAATPRAEAFAVK